MTMKTEREAEDTAHNDAIKAAADWLRRNLHKDMTASQAASVMCDRLLKRVSLRNGEFVEFTTLDDWRERDIKQRERIEQLERELAEAREGWHVEMPNVHSLQSELTAEKALADRAADRVSRWLGFDDGDGGDAAFMDAYRKARGL